MKVILCAANGFSSRNICNKFLRCDINHLSFNQGIKIEVEFYKKIKNCINLQVYML